MAPIVANCPGSSGTVPEILALSRKASQMSRMFYPHWKCTNLCPELVDTLQHSQDTFSNTRAFNINHQYVHFDLLSTWETPQKRGLCAWAWFVCVGVVGVVCPGFPFLKVGNYGLPYSNWNLINSLGQ